MGANRESGPLPPDNHCAEPDLATGLSLLKREDPADHRAATRLVRRMEREPLQDDEFTDRWGPRLQIRIGESFAFSKSFPHGLTQAGHPCGYADTGFPESQQIGGFESSQFGPDGIAAVAQIPVAAIFDPRKIPNPGRIPDLGTAPSCIREPSSLLPFRKLAL